MRTQTAQQWKHFFFIIGLVILVAALALAARILVDTKRGLRCGPLVPKPDSGRPQAIESECPTPRGKPLRIYISGAITGVPLDRVVPKFDAAEQALRISGHHPINPMKLNHAGATKWADYMANDVRVLMSEADAIYMLDDWRLSKGARIERFIAEEMGLEILGNA